MIIPVMQMLLIQKEAYSAVGQILHFICYALHDLVPFVQFKKHEKHSWRSVNFSKVAGFNGTREPTST